MGTGLRAALTLLIAALSLAATSCAGPGPSEQADYVGAWRLAGQDDADPVEFASFRRTARTRLATPPSVLACRIRDARTSPPGCSEGRSSSDFSGSWTLADGSSPGTRLSFADRFVRQGYPTDAGLAFFTGSLDVPRPDFVFVRTEAR